MDATASGCESVASEDRHRARHRNGHASGVVWRGGRGNRGQQGNREWSRAKHLYGAIDAGLVVNPGNVESQISGQLVQTASRMLKEEVTFTKTNVTSLDWASYPILRFEECPEVTPVVVQRLNERSTGAGEEVMAAAAGAIANAFFDATGVRMTEFPMTPKRVLAALKT